MTKAEAGTYLVGKKYTGRSSVLIGKPKVGAEYVVSVGAGLMSDLIVTVVPSRVYGERLDGYQQHMLDMDDACIVIDSVGQIGVIFSRYLRVMVR